MTNQLATPGPWHWDAKMQRFTFANGDRILLDFEPLSDAPHLPRTADAELMAAAPELRAMLEEVLEYSPLIHPFAPLVTKWQEVVIGIAELLARLPKEEAPPPARTLAQATVVELIRELAARAEGQELLPSMGLDLPREADS